MSSDRSDVEQIRSVDTTRVDRVLDVGALRALAHPLRVRIFDILSQGGPQTASSLADQLGESSGSTSYHLRALAKQDLIREVEGKGSARERWWERPHGSISMGDPSATRTPAGRAASQIVTTEFYRQRHEQLMHFFTESARREPAETPATLTTANTRLTHPQFEKLSADIMALIDAAVEEHRDQQGEGVSSYLVRLDLFPVDLSTAAATTAEAER